MGIIDQQQMRMVVSIAVAVWLGPNAGPSSWANAAQAAEAGFVSGAIATGNFKGAAQGAFTSLAFYGAGSLGDSLSSTAAASGETGQAAYWSEKGLGRTMLHAGVGCITSVTGGGKCGTGAASAGAAQFLGARLKAGEPVVDTFIHAMIGGTASVLGGGKFASGAQSGAFGYLFNCLSHPESCSSLFTKAGATIGTGVGVLGGIGVSAACDAATSGGCAPFNPVIVAASAVEGGIKGAAAGLALGIALDTIEKRINGNSWLSPDSTSVYMLISIYDGTILKFGITNMVGNETARYTQNEMAALSGRMVVLATYDSRAPARMTEIMLCTAYTATNGRLPPASARC
jgi:hypothetical protein